MLSAEIGVILLDVIFFRSIPSPGNFTILIYFTVNKISLCVRSIILLSIYSSADGYEAELIFLLL